MNSTSEKILQEMEQDREQLREKLQLLMRSTRTKAQIVENMPTMRSLFETTQSASREIFHLQSELEAQRKV